MKESITYKFWAYARRVPGDVIPYPEEVHSVEKGKPLVREEGGFNGRIDDLGNRRDKSDKSDFVVPDDKRDYYSIDWKATEDLRNTEPTRIFHENSLTGVVSRYRPTRIGETGTLMVKEYSDGPRYFDYTYDQSSKKVQAAFDWKSQCGGNSRNRTFWVEDTDIDPAEQKAQDTALSVVQPLVQWITDVTKRAEG